MSEIETKNNNEIDLFDLVSILIKNLKWILGISLLFMISIVIIAMISIKLPPEKSFMPNEYAPKSIIMLNSNSSGGLDSILSSSGMGSLASLAGISSGKSGISDSALAMKLVTTNSFLKKITEEFKLDIIYNTSKSEYPKSAIRNIINTKLTISEDISTGMLIISYKDINKGLATNVVNSVTVLLEEEFNRIDAVRNNDQFSMVTEKIVIVREKLESLQDEVITFQTNHNIMDVDIVAEELVTQVVLFQSELLKKEVDIESYGKVSNIKDPAYMKLVNERNAINNAIRKLENGEVGDFPPVKDLPMLALKLKKLKLEVDVQAATYKALVQQSETLKLTASGTGSTFQVLELAELPEKKSGPNRGKLCIVVTFAGFFFSIFFVFIKEAFIKIKNNPEAIRRLKGVK